MFKVLNDTQFARVQRRMAWTVDKNTGEVVARHLDTGRKVMQRTLCQCAKALNLA